MAKPSLYAGEEIVRFNFWLKKDHYTELRELAQLEGKSAAALIRELLTKFLRDDTDGQAPPAGRKR